MTAQPDSLRIIVAEDDRFMREMIAASLKPLGYTVFECADGEEALQLVGRIGAAAVVLDLQMPKVDGFAFLEAKAAVPGGKHVPTLVLTASRAMEDVKRAIAMGAADYLAKPFSGIELTHRLDRMLRRVGTTPAAPMSEDDSNALAI